MEAIVFDLDDTIIPSTHLYELALLRCSNLDSERFKRARSLAKQQIDAKSTQKHSRLLYFKCYLDEKNEFSALSLSKLYQEYEDNLKLEISLWLRNNTHRLKTLETLKKKGFKLYLATNETLAMQSAKLSIIDPEGTIFDGILTSEETGFEKPHLEFYKVLIQKFNINPEKSFFVGDDIQNDVVAPKSFNFKTVWTYEFALTPTNLSEVEASHKFKNLEELLQL